MNKIMSYCMFLIFLLGCQNDCPKCKEYPANNTSFKFKVDTEKWDITRLELSKTMEYHMQNRSNSMKIMIHSSRNEYLSTSKLTTEMSDNLSMFHPNTDMGQSETVIINKKDFIVYNFETLGDKGKKLQSVYYEYVTPSEAVSFLINFDRRDKSAQETNLNELVSKLLVEYK